jgi:hypothetical protein
MAFGSIGLLGATAAWAGTIDILADTFITVHPDLNGANSNHGAETGLYTAYPGGFETYTLLKFDILPGVQFTSGGTFEMYCYGHAVIGVNSLNMYGVTQAWEENTVTWNSFNGSYSNTVISGSQGVPVTGNWISWTIPQSVLQAWADSPSTNYGVLLVPTGGRDSVFYSREGSAGFTPRLTADFTTAAETAPEPASFGLVAGGMLCGAICLRRHKGVAKLEVSKAAGQGI